MDTQKIGRASGLIAATGLAIALVGCAGGQSTADACKIANDNFAEVQQEVQDNSQAAVDGMMNGEDVDFDSLFAPVNDALAKTQEEVTNDEVKPVVDNFATSIQGLTDELSGLDIPNMADFDPTDPEAMAQAEEMQAQAAELQTAMQTHTENIQSATTELNEVCSA